MKKITLSIILFFNLNFSYADHNPDIHIPPHIHDPCRSEEVGQEAGSTLGTIAGIGAGVYIATEIGVTGCVATGWWTAGIGCVASVGIGAITGLYFGNWAGEEIGKIFCENKDEVSR